MTALEFRQLISESGLSTVEIATRLQLHEVELLRYEIGMAPVPPLRRVRRKYASPPKGTPILVVQDYWGEIDIQTPIEVLRRRDHDENFDWEKAMSTRELTSHRVNQANNALQVLVLDDPAPSGANHHYCIKVPHDAEHGIPETRFDLIFQNGPIAEGINGITHEVLLAILIDRLQGFEQGPFANPWNTAAIEHLQDAQKVLRIRTEQRQARGVEGTHTV